MDRIAGNNTLASQRAVSCTAIGWPLGGSVELLLGGLLICLATTPLVGLYHLPAAIILPILQYVFLVDFSE